MEGQADEKIGGEIQKQKDKASEGQKDGQMDKGQLDGWKYVQTKERLGKQADGHVDKWVDGLIKDRVEGTNGWMHGQTNRSLVE